MGSCGVAHAILPRGATGARSKLHCPPFPPPPQGEPARGACNCRGWLGSHPP